MPRNALGRGLGALIREPEPRTSPDSAPSQPHATTPSAAAVAPAREPAHPGPQQIDIDLIEPSPYQPRTRFREEALEELARSIQASGIIQPLIVRPIGSRFQLIAGERRWRAAQRAGLAKVPVIVDAGVGTASDAAIAMELGVDALLMNTGIAAAKDPVLMASAMKNAVVAGRQAYLAGRMEKRLYANASSPMQDLIGAKSSG